MLLLGVEAVAGESDLVLVPSLGVVLALLFLAR